MCLAYNQVGRDVIRQDPSTARAAPRPIDMTTGPRDWPTQPAGLCITGHASKRSLMPPTECDRLAGRRGRCRCVPLPSALPGASSGREPHVVGQVPGSAVLSVHPHAAGSRRGQPRATPARLRPRRSPGAAAAARATEARPPGMIGSQTCPTPGWRMMRLTVQSSAADRLPPGQPVACGLKALRNRTLGPEQGLLVAER